MFYINVQDNCFSHGEPTRFRSARDRSVECPCLKLLNLDPYFHECELELVWIRSHMTAAQAQSTYEKPALCRMYGQMEVVVIAKYFLSSPSAG